MIHFHGIEPGFVFTFIDAEGAAWAERTAARQMSEIGGLSLNRFQPFLIWSWQGVEECFRVRHGGTVENGLGSAELNDLSCVKDGYALADGSNRADVVTDQHDRGAIFLLKFLQ